MNNAQNNIQKYKANVIFDNLELSFPILTYNTSGDTYFIKFVKPVILAQIFLKKEAKNRNFTLMHHLIFTDKRNIENIFYSKEILLNLRFSRKIVKLFSQNKLLSKLLM